MGIDDIDEEKIQAELHQISEQKRRKEEKKNALLQFHAEFSEKIGNLEEALERLDDPDGERRSGVVISGPEVSGAWLYTHPDGSGHFTRLTPRPQ